MTYEFDYELCQLEISDSQGELLKVISDGKTWLRYRALEGINDEQTKQRYLAGLLEC
jgi:hypothetical protein